MAKLFKMNYGGYYNTDAVENVIRYITRTRANEMKEEELICWGSYNTLIYNEAGIPDPEVAINQFLGVQMFYDIKKRKGKRMYHETLNLLPDEYFFLLGDQYRFPCLLYECCKYYDNMGFQVVYALHLSKSKGVHIHFAINAVNYKSGLKWHTLGYDDWLRQQAFNSYIYDQNLECLNY